VKNSEELSAITAASAQEIYGLSKDCLMAHSIRAVELYVSQKLSHKHHIVLIGGPRSVVSPNKNSWCLPGKPTSRIWVDDTLIHDEKRFCIAHELYHVILEVSPLDDAKLEAVAKEHAITKDEFVEQLCDVFARDLCAEHDKFYRNPANIDDSCKFHNLNFQSLKHVSL
jgi:hypothetical protein